MDYTEFVNRIIHLPINRVQLDRKSSEFITDSDIEWFFGNESRKYIILYSDLAKFKTIK